jgi:hypothetical protein
MPTEKSKTACPADAEIRLLAAEPFSPSNSETAAHVYGCSACLRRLEEFMYPADGCSLTDSDRGAISAAVRARAGKNSSPGDRLDKFVLDRQSAFFGGAEEWGLAAASSSAPARDAKTEEVRFVFVSDATPDPDAAWRAELTIPADAAGADVLPIEVRDRRGASAGDGLFAVAGTTLVVENGRAGMPYDLFLAGIRNSKVSFQRSGGRAVPGGLVFF